MDQERGNGAFRIVGKLFRKRDADERGTNMGHRSTSGAATPEARPEVSVAGGDAGGRMVATPSGFSDPHKAKGCSSPPRSWNKPLLCNLSFLYLHLPGEGPWL